MIAYFRYDFPSSNDAVSERIIPILVYRTKWWNSPDVLSVLEDFPDKHPEYPAYVPISWLTQRPIWQWGPTNPWHAKSRLCNRQSTGPRGPRGLGRWRCARCEVEAPSISSREPLERDMRIAWDRTDRIKLTQMLHVWNIYQHVP